MMGWKTVRLELARTPDFPRGSPARAFVVRLPLDRAGRIDAALLSTEPARAVVRRFWASERDLSGCVVQSGEDWAFLFAAQGGAEERRYRFADQPFRPDGELLIDGPEGSRLPFRVVGVRSC